MKELFLVFLNTYWPGAVVFVVTLLVIFILSRHKTPTEKRQEIDPTFDYEFTNCCYVDGLGIPTSKAAIEIYTDKLIIKVLNHNYTLNYTKLIGINELTKQQTDYIMKTHFGRAILCGIVFGDIGALLGGMPTDKEQTIIEKYVLITYESDNKMKFITLKDIDYYKLLQHVEKFKTFKQQNIEL